MSERSEADDTQLNMSNMNSSILSFINMLDLIYGEIIGKDKVLSQEFDMTQEELKQSVNSSSRTQNFILTKTFRVYIDQNLNDV